MRQTIKQQRMLQARDILRVDRGSQTLTQRVADGLKKAIRAGRFRPGERLVERKLCELTGAGRTAIREALRSLETEGLIVNAPNRGPTVATVSFEEASEIYDVRLLLEVRAVELFTARATSKELADLSASMVAVEDALARMDMRVVCELKEKLYAHIVQGCGSQLIGRISDQLHARIALLRRINDVQADCLFPAVGELRVLVDAIRTGNVKGAKVACALHIKAAKARAVNEVSGVTNCEHVLNSD